MTIVHKAFTLDALKFDDDEDGVFTGIASAVGVVDRHNEVIEAGAFQNVDTAKTFPLLWQHDPRQPIGVVKFGVNQRGDLVVEKGSINLDTQTGREAHSLMRQGAVDSMSIGFNIPQGGIQWDEDAKLARITSIDLWEVSLVTFPANPGAVITSVKELATLAAESVKAGKVLSAANRTKIEDARSALDAVLEADSKEKSEHVGHTIDAHEIGGVKTVLAAWQEAIRTRENTQDV